jgi:hypothetical protein
VLPRLARAALAAVGVALIAIGLAGLRLGMWGAAQAIIVGAVFCVGALWERARYKPIETGTPEARFQPTGERFIDPSSRTRVRVYVDPATGERKYVRE